MVDLDQEREQENKMGDIANFGGSTTSESSNSTQFNPQMMELFRRILPEFNKSVGGGESPFMGLLNQYYQQSLQNLGQEQNRALGSSATNSGAMAYARGQNPYNFVQHGQSDVYNAYAPQYGSLLNNMLGQKMQTNQSWLDILSKMLMQSGGGALNLSSGSTQKQGQSYGLTL